MTFLNTRIIQQPTLFASSRRNFGNLLEKYETGQNSTSGSGRQLTSILPEPTFTTNWTTSGLTINADISSITDAHPEFYAYLCRDDGTTLATYQFAEGQNATTLSHTEANYETFSYQLKLGTTVVSSHTETYTRPTPTYTTLFSVSELTLTASITNITDAHNSFDISLERDDGTMLQTHTLMEGETSSTFTQVESSYGTYNYVVKINGTQTDAYEASYTPPPIPTFNIALTNDDLVITASLTNIVNPDPYYTVSIHNDTSTQIASHTFSTSDTSVVLTWNETTYGVKTYTVKINGTTSSTETITLTDPNASTTITPTLLPSIDNSAVWGAWGWEYRHRVSEPNQEIYDLWDTDNDAWYFNGGFSIKVDTDNNTWADNGPTYPYSVVENSDGTVSLSAPDTGLLYKFTKPTTASWISTPSVPDIQPIVNTGGSWNGVHSWASPTTETINGSVEYHYKLSFDTNSRIAYRTIDKTWYDADISSQPTALSSDAFSTQSSALVNPQYVWIGDTSSTNTDFYVSFDNPYYEAPTTTTQSVSINNGAWTDHTFTPDDNAVSGKYAWDLQHDAGSGFYKIGDLHSLEYIPGYGWFVINVNGDGFGDVSPTSSTSGTYLDANGTSQSFSSNFAS